MNLVRRAELFAYWEHHPPMSWLLEKQVGYKPPAKKKGLVRRRGGSGFKEMNAQTLAALGLVPGRTLKG